MRSETTMSRRILVMQPQVTTNRFRAGATESRVSFREVAVELVYNLCSDTYLVEWPYYV